MLQEVKDLQNKAVTELLTKFNNKKETTFMAPTGSGKTYMMADFMNRVLSDNKDVVFLVSCLSKSNLAEQNYKKFCEYSANGNFSNIKPYLLNSNTSTEGTIHIPIDFNIYLLPTDLFKSGSNLMEKGNVLEKFLNVITSDKKFNGYGKTIYLIKDESHRATNNIDNKLSQYFTKIINISATPKPNQKPDVEITEEEALNVNLIKRIEFGNEEDEVEVAINKFEEIKENYRNLLGVNPCLIIQISNKEKGDSELKEILHVLNKIEHKDLRWMYIVNTKKDCDTNDKIAKKIPINQWKDLAKNYKPAKKTQINISTDLAKNDKADGESNDGLIDIIIFKMVITEGWDIPRACMLYQSRKSRSKQLNQQVIGRVRRNPRLLDFEMLSNEAKDLAMTSWVWGNMPNDKLKSHTVKLCNDGVEIQNEIKLKTTSLKSLSTNKDDFNVSKFLENRKKYISPPNVFQLYKNLTQSNNFIQDKCYEYSKDDISKWVEFTYNIAAINKEANNYMGDYSQSMEITKDDQGNEIEVSLPAQSIYVDNNFNIRLTNWIWNRKDGDLNFSFDSNAERIWAEILRDLVYISNNEIKENNAIKSILIEKTSLGEEINISSEQKYLWGKNYLHNSEIKYEYYLDGLHFSYPDFIMKDSFDRIHIFEVKSLCESKNINIDSEQYKIKIPELKKCYLQASKLTGHIFYIPILDKDNTWTILMMKDGKGETFTEKQFIDFVVNKETN